MKTTIPVVISVIALTLSIVTYIHSIRSANVSLSLGDTIEFYHESNQALCVHLPIIFQNTGAQAGVVRSIGLILVDSGTKEPIFMKWNGFLKPEGGDWGWESNSTPLSIPGDSEVTRMTYFYGAGNVAGWLPKPIEYELYLLAWASEDKMPSTKCVVKWTFNESDVTSVKRDLETVTAGGKANGTWITLPGYAPDSKRLSASEFKELVGY